MALFEQLIHPENTVIENSEISKLNKKVKITRADAKKIINTLPLGYRHFFSNYVRNNDIKGMQQALNGMIKTFDKEKKQALTKFLSKKSIKLNKRQILTDGKLGPQTLYTIQFISLLEQKSKTPERVQVVYDTSKSITNINHQLERYGVKKDMITTTLTNMEQILTKQDKNNLFEFLRKNDIKGIQQYLNKQNLGYSITEDGKIGPETVRAINDFCEKRKNESTN